MKTLFIFLILTTSCLSLVQAEEKATPDPGSFISIKPEGMKNLDIQYAEVDTMDFERTVFAIGNITEIPRNHARLSSRIAGRVIKLNAFEGDHVKKGDILMEVESRQPGNPPPVIQLKSPGHGLVFISHVQLGDPVEPATEMMDIVDLREVWAIAQVPEDVVSQMKPGTKAHIRIPALGNETIDGTLLRFETKADSQGATIGAIFQLKNNGNRLRPGMRAEFSIVISSRKDVMAVPREALQGDAANRVVFIKHLELPNAFTRMPVETGEKNDRYVEIISGLFPGDEVVTKGSYALSFSSGGGLSLKEALDAAHGHEHNEDGSKVEKKEGAGGHNDHTDGEKNSSTSIAPITLFLGATSIILLILLIISGIKISKLSQSSNQS
jgi:multidrug efflux pump subunit AcrA (membrane-fusion protein)